MPSILDELLGSISDDKLKEMTDQVLAEKGDMLILNIYRDFGAPKHSALVPLKDCAQAAISKYMGDLYILNMVRSAKMPHTLVWDKTKMFDLDVYINNSTKPKAQPMSEHFDEEERRRANDPE